jgi:hypothetical protein
MASEVVCNARYGEGSAALHSEVSCLCGLVSSSTVESKH